MSMIQKMENINNKNTNEEDGVPRWHFCADVVLNDFKHVVGALYLKNYFHEVKRYILTTIVKNIIVLFEEIKTDCFGYG